jgi:hypothetical protein
MVFSLLPTLQSTSVSEEFVQSEKIARYQVLVQVLVPVPIVDGRTKQPHVVVFLSAFLSIAFHLEHSTFSSAQISADSRKPVEPKDRSSMQMVSQFSKVYSRSSSAPDLASSKSRMMVQMKPSNEKTSRDLSPNKGVSFGSVLQHKIYKGVDPEGCVRYLTRTKKNQSLKHVWDSLEDYEAEKEAEKDGQIQRQFVALHQ